MSGRHDDELLNLLDSQAQDLEKALDKLSRSIALMKARHEAMAPQFVYGDRVEHKSTGRLGVVVGPFGASPGCVSVRLDDSPHTPYGFPESALRLLHR